MSDRFPTVRTEGAILPADLLQRVAAGDPSLPGLTPAAYHLIEGEKLNEAANRAWNRLQSAWTSFRAACDKLSPTDLGVGTTRDRWLLPLFQELGYGRLQPVKEAFAIGDKYYPISHVWGHVPIHLVGCRMDLDKRAAGSPSSHSLVQEFLNRSETHLWGFVSNGLKLRILRDNVRLTRQAYVEFDLQAMFDGGVYADFALLWRLCHQSRVEALPAPSPLPQGEGLGVRGECWLEQWSRAAQQQGLRVLDQLRDGVERAIATLGSGFLSCPANQPLRNRLHAGQLDAQDYYRQLLRLVYRLLFLFVAEDRGLLQPPINEPPMHADERRSDIGVHRRASAVYLSYYSTARLRRLAERLRGTQHTDLYDMLQLVMAKLGSATGCPELGLPALGSFLFSAEAIPDLEGCRLANADLLEAVRALALTSESGVLRSVDYRNLGSEELGSVYESLLELHPVLNQEAGTFELRTASGHERKTTGSYYTPTSLINALLDSALDPVLDEATEEPPMNADERRSAVEQRLLALKVCDPACGSGHFLIAAAHRLAKRLAAVRTDEEEPSPDALRVALRDVISHCIYGVDLNPMAVELCKVALWMEALVPGKPLSFLDHHIKCGNSLLGATPELLAQGIPDEAFEPIEGDDKKLCAAYKKQNKRERTDHGRGQPTFPWEQLGNLAAAFAELDAWPSDQVEQIRAKERRYAELVSEAGYRSSGRFLADLWCAAFVWKKTKEVDYPITEEIFRRVERHPHDIAPWMYDEVRCLAKQYQFFHWHLEFPEVFQPPMNADKRRSESDQSIGVYRRLSAVPSGFDVVLGNPPWERIKLQEQEFFAARRPEIANAPTAAARRKLIAELRQTDHALYGAYHEALRQAEGASALVRNSGRYPLCGRGDVNTYSIFAELMRSLLSPRGRAGCIVPTGIATDATNQHFFRDLVDSQALVSLYDFENRKGIFPGVHRSYKFCLLTLAGAAARMSAAQFAFFCHDVADLEDPERRFTLSPEDFRLLNPNTGTAPIFRTRRDAEITKAIYRRVPVLIKEGLPAENPWGVEFLRMFDMANDSHLFTAEDEPPMNEPPMNADERRWDIGVDRRSSAVLPLYEAKMVHQFTHRWATYEGGTTRDVTSEELADPHFVVRPRYWVPAAEVEARLSAKGWDRGWLLGWRDITNTTNERTVIASILPRVAVGNNAPLMILADSHANLGGQLAACLSSFVLDYVARLKVGGTHLNYFIYKQLPVLPPEVYEQACPWAGSTPDKASGSSVVNYAAWLLPRVLELTYTAWDLQPFARDCGYDGPPFRWDPERRFLLRCELDAAFFHLYGISRDDAAYILDTFPIVRRKDEEKHGEYRTKRVILEVYDALSEAIRTGQAYQTRLATPPADPGAVHALREG
jgi:hypothetical protein